MLKVYSHTTIVIAEKSLIVTHEILSKHIALQEGIGSPLPGACFCGGRYCRVSRCFGRYAGRFRVFGCGEESCDAA